MNRVNAAIALQTSCSGCITNYIISGGVCQLCSASVSYCATCAYPGYCYTCLPGYYIYNYYTCYACNTNCATCSSSSNCLTCNPPLTLSQSASNKVCQLCKQPCITCKSTDLSFCYLCKQPFSKSATNAGLCYKCDQDSCLACNSANTATCTLCRDGFNLNITNNTCIKCPINCLLCYNNICYQCIEGYALNSTTGMCMGCAPGCLTCSNTNISLCSTCRDGTFYQVTNYTCQPCSSACVTCTSLANCIVAKNGLVIFNNQAIQCRPGCKQCSPFNPQTCIQCSSRFFLTNGICKACPNNCMKCSSATTCTQCLDNISLNGGLCNVCQGNCRTCSPTNTSQCLTCIVGYNLQAQQCVHNCDIGCQQCSDSNSSICITCKHGYTLKSDLTCIKCTKYCSGTCDAKNINTCLNCINGFYLTNNICKKCPQGCQTCLNGQCSTCQLGYSIAVDNNNNQICKQICNYPCIQCNNNNNNNICTKCQINYILTNGICSADISCNPNCQYCPIGTYNSATYPTITCTKCSSNLCSTCPSGICTSCVDGYYLNIATCTVCPIQCKSCYNSLACKICTKGYTKQLISITNNDLTTAVFNDTCKKCDNNCLTCDIMITRCTSCVQGMYLLGWRCVNMYTIYFEYKLDYTYNTFILNGQSQNFIKKIAQISIVNIDDTYITNITQGSTIIIGSVSTTGKTNALIIQSSLNQQSTGYYVISSSNTIYYGQYPDYQPIPISYVPLIVGIIIGVLAIGLIVFIIVYKIREKRRKYRQRNNQDDEIEMENSKAQIVPELSDQKFENQYYIRKNKNKFGKKKIKRGL